jgi:hypothetical protein
LDAKCPVYIDFGNEWLVRLEVYDETGLRCIRMVAKEKFIHDVMTETRALDIGTRFDRLATVAVPPVAAGSRK